MGNREQLRDSLQKDSQQRKDGFWHSKAYHRFFEGYSEVTVPNPKGKGTIIQRIYSGNYYRQDLTKSKRILLRVLYVLLFLGAAYLFISSAVSPLPSNSIRYVTVTQAISLTLLVWILIVFLTYLPAGWDMTIHGYRTTSLALLKASLFSTFSLGAVALATMVFIIFSRPNEVQAELTCTAKYLVAGILVFSIYLIEKKVSYLIIPSQNSLPVESNEPKLD